MPTHREKELAHAILPILVQRAMDCRPITYMDLAVEVSEPPRKLGNPLGYIRVMLEELGEQWNEDIPHIQGIVVRQDTGLPGSRFLLYLFCDPTEKESLDKWNEMSIAIRGG